MSKKKYDVMAMQTMDQDTAQNPKTEIKRSSTKSSSGRPRRLRTAYRMSFKCVWSYRCFVIPAASILLLLPLIYSVDDEDIPRRARKCLYVMLVMAVCWVTEAVPIAVTALFPLVMFPLAGVISAKATASAYISDTTMLFLGGLIVAVAVEEWNLHKRIAVGVMLLVGSDPKWIMAGLMLPTWFLSMWISNTATASMMLPIAVAVLHQMKPTTRMRKKHQTNGEALPEEGQDNEAYEGDAQTEKSADDKPISGKGRDYVANPNEANLEITDSEIQWSAAEADDPGYIRKCKGLTLCIAYAANVGGIGILTGTPPNLVLRDAADNLYDEYQLPGKEKDGSPISFANWMGFAVPLSFITLILGWSLLVLFFLTGRGCCTSYPQQAAAVKRVIREEWRSLGRITFAEVMMIILFATLAVLWISRDPKEVDGWVVWFHSNYPSDATSAMLVAVLLFILPAKFPFPNCCSNRRNINADPREFFYTPLLTWDKVHQKVPWGVMLLLGGGFALAKGVRESDLDDWLAEQLEKLDWLDTWVFVFVLCLIVAAFTEVTSNTATAQILMPILSNLAISLQENPLYFMAPACIATSFAFMLPVATPPNAIVFSYGHIKVIDMTIVGFFMNILAVCCLTLCVNTWGYEIYDFGDLDARFVRNTTTS